MRSTGYPPQLPPDRLDPQLALADAFEPKPPREIVRVTVGIAFVEVLDGAL